MLRTLFKIALAILVIAIYGTLIYSFFSLLHAFIVGPTSPIFEALLVMAGFLAFSAFLAWVLWGKS